jgi:hypothetical protein
MSTAVWLATWVERNPWVGERGMPSRTPPGGRGWWRPQPPVWEAKSALGSRERGDLPDQ